MSRLNRTPDVGHPLTFGPSQLSEGVAGPRWRNRVAKLLGQMAIARGAHPEMLAFLVEAEEWLEMAMQQVAAATGGECGVIESNALCTAAWQTAFARYWMHCAARDPTNTKLFETASRVADAARANSLQAYDLAVKLARANHAQPSLDPLAAFERAKFVNAQPTEKAEMALRDLETSGNDAPVRGASPRGGSPAPVAGPGPEEAGTLKGGFLDDDE